jgi:hypothetical protein
MDSVGPIMLKKNQFSLYITVRDMYYMWLVKYAVNTQIKGYRHGT